MNEDKKDEWERRATKTNRRRRKRRRNVEKTQTRGNRI